MITFNDLLAKADLEPEFVLIMRHRPDDPGLKKVLPWFASERPALFNAYQRVQAGKNAERALERAEYLASFLGITPRFAHFVGIYRRGDYRDISNDEYWSIPENEELHRFGMSNAAIRPNSVRFELELMELLCDWQGKLVLSWTGLERSWYRWAHRNTFPIHAVLEESAFSEVMPAWDELLLTWPQLQALPRQWASSLREWRGIYLIFDERDGRGYVGSAYGSDNILGRWLSYASTGHGGNKELRKRDPRTFRFSILQRVSPDMEPSDVLRLEAAWKTRLHTRDHGLNEN